MNLPELLKTAAAIAEDRYDSDFSIARIDARWRVSFRKKLHTGFTWVEVGEGSTAEKALEKTLQIETDKAQVELDGAREFIRKVGLKK